MANSLSLLAMVVGLYVWAFVATVLHECAHVVMGRLVGFLPFAATVGTGPLLIARNVAGMAVRIHALPGFGLVRARLYPAGLRWRGTLFSIAGLLSDGLLLTAAILYAGTARVEQSSPVHLFFGICVLWQFMVILGTLAPSDYWVEGRRISNDGKQVFEYLTGRMSSVWKEYEKILAHYDPTFKLKDSWLMRSDERLVGLYSQAARDLAAGRHQEAVEKWLRVLDEAEMHPVERALLLDRMASIPILRGDQRYLEPAEHWARQACALVPGSKTLRGTLGAILVDRGRFAEGLELLEPLTSEDNEAYDRTLARRFVAKARDLATRVKN